MIIVKLSGGLGNQLFQFAAGFSLAKLNNCALKLDLSFFYQYKLHEYSLKHFAITSEVINPYNEFLFKIFTKLPFIFELLPNLPPYKARIYKEQGLEYDSAFFDQRGDIYLEGYWQSEKYFKTIEKDLRKELVFKNYSSVNKNILENISQNNSVSIHIRRGDYVLNKQTNASHGVCDLEYYRNAVNYLINEKKILNPVFFVFSDDIQWVKNNLFINNKCVFVDNNPEFDGERYLSSHNHEDLMLMSLCKHNIIANSSYSWWAAWLNKNPDKIIVSPTKWYNDAKRNSSDLIPDNWIKI